MTESKKQTWLVELKTVTPAFVGGAAPNAGAEIRVPSIRGALRAWYRLLVGPDAAAGLQLKDPAEAESRLFGGTARGEGQGRLVLSLTGPPPRGAMPWTGRVGTGRGYLGFSLNLGSNRRLAVPPGTRFGLRFTFPRGIAATEAKRLYGTLWTWCWLGGLGSRSHRALGSLAPAAWPPRVADLAGNSLKPPLDLPDPSRTTNLRDFAYRLAEGLWTVDDTMMLGREHQVPPQPACRLGKDHPVVVWAGASGTPWPSWEGALEEIGQHLADFRKQRDIDGIPGGTLRTLEAGRPLRQAPARTTFGLPLGLQRIRPRGRRFELRPYVADPLPGSSRAEELGRAYQDVRGRAPSPLFIHLAPCGKGYVAVYTLMAGPWPGRDLDIREARQSRGFAPAVPNLDLPLRYIRSLPGRKEVKL